MSIETLRCVTFHPKRVIPVYTEPSYAADCSSEPLRYLVSNREHIALPGLTGRKVGTVIASCSVICDELRPWSLANERRRCENQQAAHFLSHY